MESSSSSADTFAIVAAIATPVATLVGVVIGSWLSRRNARDERAWSERESVRARQVEVAAQFDTELMEAMAGVPTRVELGRAAVDLIGDGWQALRRAWQRTTLLDDPGFEQRIAALDMALFIAQQDAQFRKDEQVNFWPLGVASRDLRKALAAYQRREPLPEPEFPTASELIRLAHPEGRNVGIDGAREWMMERGVM